MPNNGNDPIVIAAQIVSAFQSIVARNVEPLESGVVTIGHIEGGHTHNVIPEKVLLQGTARWFRPEIGDLLESKIRALATGIATAYGAEADVTFTRLYPATVNEESSTDLARQAAAAVVGDSRVVHMDKPTMGGEDFSFMLNVKPGSYLMLGGGRTGSDPQVHHPKYDFNDDLLPIGASYFAQLAERLLPR
jgi:hippurate hydrolase